MIKVQGAKETEQALRELPGKTANKFAKVALRAGCKILQSQAKSNVPVKSGLTRRSIRIKVGRAQNHLVTVMVTIGQKMYQGKLFYAAFIEFGHFTGKRLRQKFRGPNAQEHYHAASKAAGRKFIPGVHFMQGAAESKGAEAARAAEQKIVELISKEGMK